MSFPAIGRFKLLSLSENLVSKNILLEWVLHPSVQIPYNSIRGRSFEHLKWKNMITIRFKGQKVCMLLQL